MRLSTQRLRGSVRVRRLFQIRGRPLGTKANPLDEYGWSMVSTFRLGASDRCSQMKVTGRAQIEQREAIGAAIRTRSKVGMSLQS